MLKIVLISFFIILLFIAIGCVVGTVLLIASENREQKNKPINIDNTEPKNVTKETLTGLLGQAGYVALAEHLKLHPELLSELSSDERSLVKKKLLALGYLSSEEYERIFSFSNKIATIEI